MYKQVLSSTLPLIVVIILSIVVGNYGIGRVLRLQAQISQLNNDKATLSQKLTTLQGISATVGAGSQVAASALPGKNPALTTLSQIKSLATQNVVTLTNLKSGSESKSTAGFSEVGISFDVTGPRSGIIAFLDSIPKNAPITIVDKIKLNEAGGEARATVSVRSFWVAFPTTLPPVAENIPDLTQAEKDTLNKISALIQPQFIDVPAQEGESGRTNPFTQ